MDGLRIGQVAQRAGIATSTLRYYEEIGLLEPARRVSGRRLYDDGVFQRLALIQSGQQAGFTLAEIGVLLHHVLDAQSGGATWHDLVKRKLSEMEAKLRSIESMRGLLEDIMNCDDEALAECIVQTTRRHPALSL